MQFSHELVEFWDYTYFQKKIYANSHYSEGKKFEKQEQTWMSRKAYWKSFSPDKKSCQF